MWLESFCEYLQLERNYSPHTVKGYSDDLKAFEAFYRQKDEGLNWGTVDADVVRNWMADMIRAGKTAATVNRRLSALRAFYKYLLKREWIKVDPVRHLQGPKTKKVLPSFVREEEMDRLIDGAFFPEDFRGQRDGLVVYMFYVTGMRLSELVGLNDPDIDFTAKVIKVTGKRNKQRLIPFGEELERFMKAYLEQRPEAVPEEEGIPFFVGDKGKRIGTAYVKAMVRKYLGLVTTQKKRSPHVLRHTFATMMLNHDADLESLRELLGHESIATTQVYTHLTFEELKKMYNQAHPRA